MLSAFVEKIVERGIIQERIPKEQRSVYHYGYMLLLEITVCTIFATVLAVVMNKTVELAIFFSTFVPLRCLGGGYHTSKPWKCVALSYLVLYVFFTLSDCRLLALQWEVVIIVEFIALIFVQPAIEVLKYTKFITSKTLVNMICCVCWYIVIIGRLRYTPAVLLGVMIWLVSISIDYISKSINKLKC